ncbi:MAG: hypothetical protein ACREVE_14125 [Gammaproteobacteria bacterium]
MMRRIFSPRYNRATPMLAMLGAMIVGVVLPCLARQAENSGWAEPPNARRFELPNQEKPVVPGWQAAAKLDPRLKMLELHHQRAFGVLAGDKVRLELAVAVEKPYRLQRSSLPPSRWVNSWLELQNVRARHIAGERLNRYAIAINYQIFATPRAVTLDAIPGFDLRFADGARSFALSVPDWVFSMSPLLRPEPEADDMTAIPVRADAPPLTVDATWPAAGVALFGLLSALLGVYWLYFKALWPFARRADAPFAHACRRLRALQRRRDERALPDGFRLVHQAFNQTAGEVLFAEHLERFFAKWPSFAERRAGIEGFFQRSRRLFFSGGGAREADNTDLTWLESLCRQCRAAEREAR